MIENEGRPYFNKQVLKVGGGFVAAGLLIKLISGKFKADKARIGNKYTLRLSDYSS